MRSKPQNKSARLRYRSLAIEALEDRRMLSGSPNADFNGSGMIDAADLGIWEAGFGTGTTQAQGDANGDNSVNGSDFLQWQRQLGQPAPSTLCVDVSIDGQSEVFEDSTGAIVFRNSDFSKQSLAALQPESGEPLFVPDYLAPAGTFDPNAANDFTTASVSITPSMVGNYQVQLTFDDTKNSGHLHLGEGWKRRAAVVSKYVRELL